MKKLSYIIPVYNGQDFIVRCLDSICSLCIPVEEYEVIVVDDCSTDNTRELVNEYISTHSQVQLICQPQNHRQGAARNRGLKECQGEYVTFIDADDLVLKGFEMSFQIIRNNSYDLIYGYMEIERQDSMFIHQLSKAPVMCMSGISFAEQYHDEGVFFYPPSYIYRRQFLLDINGFFVEDRRHEDRDWLANVLVHAESVAVNPCVTYRYVFNVNSTCHTLSYSTVFDHVASGIRHIQLSKELRVDCPNLSKTLYVFGVDEIYKNLRLRNLSKFTWEDNRHLYDEKHLAPLLSELKKVCRTENVPFAVHFVAYCHAIELPILCLANPLARTGRKIVSLLR